MPKERLVGPYNFKKSTLDIVLASGGSTNPICYLFGQT